MNSGVKKICKNILMFVFFYLALVAGGLASYSHIKFGTVSFDIVLYLFNDVFKLDWAIKEIKLYLIIFLFVSFFMVYFFKNKHLIISAILLFSLPFAEFDMFSYFYYRYLPTNFYEENYVKPQIDPSQKNNLVVIFLEGFEDYFASDDISPSLAKLKKENISFKGFQQLSSADTTINGHFASLCATPFNQEQDHLNDTTFPSKILCIPDLLKKNGYSTAYLDSADVKFAQADILSQKHGFDIVKGFFELEEDASKITKDYKGNRFGGLKDRVIFEIAKKEILSLKQPFFISIASLDTHSYPEIFYDPDCSKKFNNYLDAVKCTGDIVVSFVDWLKKQSFWNNTTLVIIGDHKFGNEKFSKNHIINIFINSKKTPHDTNKVFTTYDLAPTILEATGYEIEKYGIGRSLFSKNPTLFRNNNEKFDLIITGKNNMFSE